MDDKTFKELSTGDLVQGYYDHQIYIVMANYGNRITAVKTVDMTNPIEWNLINKASYK